jgi:hypothetical protein
MKMSDKTLVELILERKRLLDKRQDLKSKNKQGTKAWQINAAKIEDVNKLIRKKEDPR